MKQSIIISACGILLLLTLYIYFNATHENEKLKFEFRVYKHTTDTLISDLFRIASKKQDKVTEDSIYLLIGYCASNNDNSEVNQYGNIKWVSPYFPTEPEIKKSIKQLVPKAYRPIVVGMHQFKISHKPYQHQPTAL